MVDDVSLTGADGAFTAATDEIGGVHFQKIKLAFGPLDTATLVSASDPLPVSVGTVAVTGGLTDTQLRAAPVPVSGTFYPATQPVSGTVAATQSGTWNIGSITALPALAAGSAIIGALTANQTVDNAKINGVTPLMGNGVTGTGSLRVTIASDNTAFAVNATGPTLTKATQGATGYSVQQLKDAGRVTLAMTAEFTHAQIAETLLTMTLSSNSGANGTFSSRGITSGKRLRLQSVIIQIESLGSGTAPQRAYLRMRSNTGGATTTASALQWILPVGVTTAIVKASCWASMNFPDGLELPGDGTATFGFTLETPDWVNTTGTGRTKITIIGFEY